MFLHTSARSFGISLDDQSMWFYKGTHWLSGMDFPYDRLVEGDAKFCAKRDEPFRYHDFKPLTDEERAGIASILASYNPPDTTR